MSVQPLGLNLGSIHPSKRPYVSQSSRAFVIKVWVWEERTLGEHSLWEEVMGLGGKVQVI